MTKSHKGRLFRCSVASAWMCFVALTFSAAVSVSVADTLVEPLYTSAAFSQINSGSSPNRVFTTSLHLFALDSAAKRITVWKKTTSGAQLRQFSGVADIADGSGAKGFIFASPWGMAKHPTQNIIAVTDKGISAQRITFYAYTETASAVQFTYLGSYGDIPNPADVAFFANGDVAVCGNLSNGVNPYAGRLTGPYSAMSPTGSNLFPAPATGTVDGLDIDPATGHIFMASASRHCVYESDGAAIVQTYGTPGSAGSSGGKLSGPSDVAVLSGTAFSKKLLVADQFNNKITVFNVGFPGTVHMTFGGLGTEPGQMSKPFSVYAANNTAEVTVADTINRRLQVLSLYNALIDNDEDGLDNTQENDLGTDPNDKDTDNDGFEDGYEVNTLGSDPLDPNSPGAGSIVVLGAHSYNENTSATQSLTVILGSMPSNETVIAVSGYIPDYAQGDATLTFPAGVNTAILHFIALNGPTNGTLTLSQTPPGDYAPTNFTFSISNVAPSILSATAGVYTVTEGGAVGLFATATDPSTDVLTYQWTFDDGSPAIDDANGTNIFLVVGQVLVTVTVTDQDGASDTASFVITVEEGVQGPIDFTAITTASSTFRIPTSAKSNNFLIKTSEELALPDVSWTDWLFINGADIVGVGTSGTFTASALVAPGYDVNVTVEDSTNDLTFISFDITELYNTYTNQFFKAILIDD